MEIQNNNINTADKELRVSRILNAPFELVWEVQTNPEHIKNWQGQSEFRNMISVMDFRTGGDWELVIHGPGGTDYKNTSIYKEIVKYQHIVYDQISGPKFTASIEFEA